MSLIIIPPMFPKPEIGEKIDRKHMFSFINRDAFKDTNEYLELVDKEIMNSDNGDDIKKLKRERGQFLFNQYKSALLDCNTLKR